MYRLLIADDNAARAQITSSLLDWSAYSITSLVTASTWSEAEAKALELRPQLALVNLHFDSRLGYSLITHLRSLGVKTAFCIVAEQNSPDQIRECMRSGAQDYLLRPLNSGEVRSFLERAIAGELIGSAEDNSRDLDIDPVLQVPYDTLSKLTNRIIQVVRSDFRSPQSLTAIAANLGMSSKYIGRVFLKDTGIKFSEYLMSFRMLEAKKRIIGSREKISVIAASVGYVQMNNFYIHFKNYFGVSPSALRNFDSSRESTAQSGEQYEESV